ncbi:hypothetical protein ACSBR2_010608 [Camellia fascicularis]
MVKVSFISTPRNIHRLPKLPPNLSPLINLVISKVDQLPQNAKSTLDPPHRKVKYLMKAFSYDQLQQPMSQILSDLSPNWVNYDFANWLGPLASKLGIPRVFFSAYVVFSGSCTSVKVHEWWGTAAHLVFLTFCFLTNIIVTAMLLLGGSAVVNALTGVNIYAASFLIPLGVIIYTLAGGLKATLLASYIHLVIVHIVLVVFVYLVYTSSSKFGSPSIAYHRLLEGSYLTMLSSGGLVFGIINIVGNFGTVFVDNGYWVSAIAARPSSTHKGYLLGGLVWFAVPFSLATSLGLGALALDLPITASEASHGL